MFGISVPSGTKESARFIDSFRRTFGGKNRNSSTDPTTPTNSSRKSNGSQLSAVGENDKVLSLTNTDFNHYNL